MADDAVAAARAAVRDRLAPGELVEHATMAEVGTKVSFRLRFFGIGPGRGKPVLLTGSRLLVVRRGAGPDTADWVDLQLDRSRIGAELPRPVGGGFVVELQTGLGERVLVFRAEREAEARRLAGLLRGNG